jgi:glycosyltransferase involved in cell wall biosynthesis
MLSAMISSAPTPTAPAPGRTAIASPLIEIVIPVHNEQATLERSILRLHEFLTANLPYAWRIVIADNASTDATAFIGRELAGELAQVGFLQLREKGRGRALRAAWSASDADVLCYMDVDLSTSLEALLPLVAGLVSGHSDVAIGTRLAAGSRVVRGLKREFISRSYNRILRLALGARFSDAQCGFKAIRAEVARRLLPQIRDESWFFDTELLILAQRQRLRVHEVPVDWIDDPDSRVNIVRTAFEDLRGIARLRLATPLFRFLLIGVASTLAYALLFLLLRGASGPAGANALALALTAVANTQANRRFTFGIKGRKGLLRQHCAGAIVFLIALGLTDSALLLMHRLDPHPAAAVEVVVLVAASAFATAVRYVALRSWVFAGRRSRRARAARRRQPLRALTGGLG